LRSRALLLVPLALYLAFPTRNFYWDGVRFAIEIEKNLPLSALAQPNHLIYEVCGAWLYDAFDAMGFPIRALYLMQAANCLLAGLAVILLYRILRGKGWTNERSLIAACIFGFSATWWKFATDANAYVPSVLLLLCAYVLLDKPRWVWLAGLATAGAMLFHELAIFFLPVAFFVLWKRRGLLSTFAAAAVIPVAAAYALTYQAAHPSESFFAWLTSHSADSAFSFSPLKDLGYTLRGTVRLLFGGRWPDLVPNALSIAACVLLAIAAGALLYYARQAFPWKWTPPTPTIVWWIAVYLAFLFFWMPQNTFYRLFYLAPLIVMLAPQANRAAAMFAAVILLWNFAFLIYPESRPEFNAPLRFALAQHDAWPAGSAIVFHRFHPDLWTISYFNSQASWVGLDNPDLNQMEQDLAYARGNQKPLWVEETAYDLLEASPQGRDWLVQHERREELVRFKDEKHEYIFHSMR
jgi:uncharacterized membrane protein YecN with MAPEG domain